MSIPQPRMTHVVELIPDAMKAIYALKASATKSGLPATLFTMIDLRASQINGCSFCVDMHARELKKAGESDERIHSIAAWREAPYYTDAERAALALTEAVTRLSDREDPVPDAVWNEAARHYNETQLASILIGIATINIWNRFNVAIRQPAGQWPS